MEKDWKEQRNQIIGLGENSFKKSYYPELQSKIAELENSYNNLQTIFNSINDGIVIHDTKGKILLLNKHSAEIFNIDNLSEKEYTVFDVSSEKMNYNALYPIWDDVFNGNSRIIDWTVLQTNTNKEFIVQVSLNKALFYGQQVLVAVIRDFTERLKFEQELIIAKEKAEKSEQNLQLKNEEYEALNEELRQANEELIMAKEKAEESNRLKTAFLQNMSHEIRTPMNAIIGFTELLNDPTLKPDKRKHYTSIVNKSSTQLLSIVTDILTISFLETNQEKVNITDVCINEILDELNATFKPQITNKNIELKVKKLLTLKSSIVYTDKTKITQILTNLISNAIKFTDSGFVEFGYLLTQENNGVFLQFYVKDSGIGIKAEKHEKIFERFRQANKLIHTNYGGTGLGLSISKGFVTLLGGKIWIESEINKGSTFYFTIPYKQTTTSANNNSKNNEMQIDSNKNTTKILVAEDEEYNYLYMKELLIRMGLSPIHSKDGQETIDICKENDNISLILMDIKMPNIDGYEAAIEIKKIKPEIPIIAQTAYGLEHEIEKYKDVFNAYLTKPIDKHKLQRIISEYI